MEKFYEGDKEVPSLIGTVEKADGRVQGKSGGQYELELKVNSFEAPVIVPLASNLRVDVGERVRLYSSLGFNKPRNACGGLIKIDALEILGEDEMPLFRYTSSPCEDGSFKEVD